jgi:hypothetical protein
MAVCLCFFCVVLSYVGTDLASGWSPIQGALQNVHRFINSEKLQILSRNRPWGLILEDDDNDDDDDDDNLCLLKSIVFLAISSLHKIYSFISVWQKLWYGGWNLRHTKLELSAIGLYWPTFYTVFFGFSRRLAELTLKELSLNFRFTDDKNFTTYSYNRSFTEQYRQTLWYIPSPSVSGF